MAASQHYAPRLLQGNYIAEIEASFLWQTINTLPPPSVTFKQGSPSKITTHRILPSTKNVSSMATTHNNTPNNCSKPSPNTAANKQAQPHLYIITGHRHLNPTEHKIFTTQVSHYISYITCSKTAHFKLFLQEYFNIFDFMRTDTFHVWKNTTCHC